MASFTSNYQIYNKNCNSKFLLLCDHATNHIPNSISKRRLGLTKEQLRSHIAYDIGAKETALRISNNLNSPLLKTSELKIFLNTGREVIAGSTRLKAGTSQKVCLNLLSTLLMVKLKKVKDGRMINLKPLNKKLRERLRGIKKYLIK